MRERWGRGTWGLALLAGLLLAALAAVELRDELDSPLDAVVEVMQLAMLVGASVASSLLVLRLQAQAEETRLLRQDVELIREAGRRRQEEMAGEVATLRAGIRRQLAAWRLTPAEQDVALLLLKGLSHKEIARARHTGEATIRQQAAAVYQKSGLSGRAALSAYFLDDLLAG